VTALWGRFLRAKTRLEFRQLKEQNQVMSQAVDALEQLSRDPEARRAARKRLDDQRFHEMGIAMTRQQARDEGREEGIALGEAKGVASALRRLLTVKFGSLDDAVEARLRAASLPELERWTERILTADSVADVFAE
jgi:flagellar biosynthesis/type III secretory pathway protein FliH